MDTIEKYFPKKRELSSKSNDGITAKKLREEERHLSATSDVSVSNDNVLDVGLDSSTCRNIFY